MNRISNRRWWLPAALAITAATGGLAGVAIAQGGVSPHAMHGGPSGHAMSAAEMDAHFDMMLATMIPDATPEQRSKLKAAIGTTHGEIAKVHAGFAETHSRAHALLLAPRIDRAALESLRAGQIAALDASSRRMFDAVADAAELLTPEQRARIAEHLKSRPH